MHERRHERAKRRHHAVGMLVAQREGVEFDHERVELARRAPQHCRQVLHLGRDHFLAHVAVLRLAALLVAPRVRRPVDHALDLGPLARDARYDLLQLLRMANQMGWLTAGRRRLAVQHLEVIIRARRHDGVDQCVRLLLQQRTGSTLANVLLQPQQHRRDTVARVLHDRDRRTRVMLLGRLVDRDLARNVHVQHSLRTI